MLQDINRQGGEKWTRISVLRSLRQVAYRQLDYRQVCLTCTTMAGGGIY